MIQKLSKAAEAKLMDALEIASDEMSNGVHPNDAIIKAANQYKVPAGHIQLMVSAVNIGKTNAQRLTGDSVSEKAASFPVADTSTILAELYPDTVKTASDIYSSSVISTEYDAPPHWLETKNRREKAATVHINWDMCNGKKPVEYPHDEESLIKKATGQADRYRKEIDEARRQVWQVYDKSTKLAEDLKEYFKSTKALPLNSVKENATLFFGEKAAHIIDNIISFTPNTYTLPNQTTNINHKPYTIIKSLMQTKEAYLKAKKDYEQTTKVAEEGIKDVMRPFARGLCDGTSVLEGLSCQPTKEAFSVGDMVAGGFGYFKGQDAAGELAKSIPGAPKTKADLYRKDLETIFDPSHEQNIKNIQFEAMLHDLAANDDVVRGYKPHEILDATNELAQSFPHVVHNKAIFRDLLRKRLSGGPQAIDQFVSGDLARTSGQLKQLGEISDPSVKILQSMGTLNAPQQNRSVLG